MARYTKKDADGRYYIESANGKLESNIKGHTYGEAIDRFAELENADVAPKSEVDWNSIPVDVSEALKQRAVEKAKTEVAREIFEEIEKETEIGRIMNACAIVSLDAIAELKKKYTGEQT